MRAIIPTRAIWGLLLLALPGGLCAQQFEPIAPLYFTRPFDAPDPLPQVLAIASTTGNAFEFTVTTSTSSGGSWLSASPTGAACCITPRGVSIIVNTGVNGASMGPGTYSGQVSFSAGGVTTVNVAVTFVIAASTATFFDNTPGQVSFSMQPGGQPPPQVLQIRNAGAGTLGWTLTASTFNSANWISVSATSGTAPSVITVGIVTASLPGGGITAGTYSGQLLIQTAGGGSIVTVPIGLTVAANAMPQVNALSFSKPYTGTNPLPQTVTLANGSGAAFEFSISTKTATGSLNATSWLSASPTGGNCCVSPKAVIVSVVPSITLAAGTYTGQVLADNGSQAMVIPVTLNVGAPDTAFFDNIAGQLSFFMQTGATTTPPNQLLQIRNAGTGTLNWTVTPTTFDSGDWLTVSDLDDNAPTQISIGIEPSSLPSHALTAGVYTANLLFQSGGSSVTVPITVQVGPSFRQVNGIDFTMLQAGPDPLPQNVTISATTTAAFEFTVDYSTATGGAWLKVSPSGGSCCVTPEALEVSVIAPPTMAAGTYTAEIVVLGGTTSLTVPVTLTVATPATPYFDNLPGGMTFSMLTNAPNPPSSQVFQIRNAGSGVLNWTLTANTSDGGNWLTVSAANGTAPEIVTVGIVPGNLPGGGLVAGAFVGQLLLQGGGTSVTIPVGMEVGTTGFVPVNGLNFTMQQTGANPLPQVITATTAGAAFEFSIAASTATGGSWLTVSPVGGSTGVTPQAVIVTVNAAPTLAAGIYTGQISFYSGSLSQTVPVTLTVAPASTPFFDNVPGALSYAMAVQSGGHIANPPSQNVQIRNRGTGTLSWTAQVFTSDGGNWLTVSAPNGTAPSLVSIGIVTQNLQNQGLVAGLFTGEVLFLAGNSSSVTVPVSVRVGGNGFVQVNPIDFTMPLAGANPLPQILTITTPGAAFEYSVSAPTGNGGTWMTVSPTGGSCCVTPDVLTVTVSAPVGLAAGSYTGEVIADVGTSAMVVPVTLTVAPTGVPFFDNLQGQMSFFSAVNTTSTSQPILIEGLGAFGLNWTLTPITADTGNWLVPSATTGTAPSSITVGINIQNLPNLGLEAGLFTGQLLFQSDSSSVTVPVSVKLGPPGFSQLAPLNFSMLYGAASPLSQTLNASSSGTNYEYSVAASAGNGGNWLSSSPTGSGCCVTPGTVTVKVNGAPGGTPISAGIHTGQAVMNEGAFAMTVPVILTVNGTPILSIAKSHTGNFNAGQSNAIYSVTVTNQAGAGIGTTNSGVTVTETVPAGMTLVSMAGTGWTCPSKGNTCTRGDPLPSGQSYEPITVTVNVVTTSQTVLTNEVSVSGGGATSSANASDKTNIITRCDINQAGTISVSEIQTMINELLGLAQAANDLNADGVVNVVDVQVVVNAALGLGCLAM